jgi:enoyl-CoA hydratase/carnithine racemase
MADEILTASEEHICTVTLNRPDKRNALSASMVDQLRSRLEQVAADPAVRVIVLRANGPAFCAGLDLREMAEQRAAGEADLSPLEVVLETLEACPQPTIAAVQGDSIAGGCELALHCDIRVGSDAARFAMPLARIGLAVPVTLTWKLVDMIGYAKTYELLLTGDAVNATTALQLGLLNRLVSGAELDEAAHGLARQIAQNAPLGVRAMKAFVRRAASFRRQINRDDLEEMHRQVRMSADLKEGLAAQRERRTPVFQGK